jgi:hypothetical protein
MRINPRFIAQKSRVERGLVKPQKARAQPRKPRPNCKGFWRWKGIFVTLETAGAFLHNCRFLLGLTGMLV